jgi:hypothetical protein
MTAWPSTTEETMNAPCGSNDPVADVEAELRRLRKRLADAWWNEESLELIEQLQAQIHCCQARLQPQP